MTIAKNDDTLKFGRESRFLIDDPNSGDMLSYSLTKPLKVGKTYNNKGVYLFVLQEVVSTVDDNMELGIADYYKYFPKEQPNENNSTEESEEPDDSNEPPQSTNKKRMWL